MQQDSALIPQVVYPEHQYALHLKKQYFPAQFSFLQHYQLYVQNIIMEA